MGYNCSKNVESCIRRIIETVENMDQIRKAVFYSDPEVELLLENLYERWRLDNYRSEPLYYAKPSELEKILGLALYYATIPIWQAYKMFVEGRSKPGKKA